MRLRLCSRGDTAAVSPCWFLREQHGGRGARASHEQPRSITLGGGVDVRGGVVPEQICRLRGAMAVRGWDMTRCARGMTAKKENRGTYLVQVKRWRCVAGT